MEGDLEMKIAMAQIKPVTGDLEGNTEKIIDDIKKAIEDKADFILFPETAITGYCCGALYEKEDFIQYNKQILKDVIAKKIPKDLVAVIGFVDYKGKKLDGSLDLRNSVAIIQDQEIIGTYDKILLANGEHHEDKKYFTGGKDAKVFEIVVKEKMLKIGTPICEDLWFQHHMRDVVQEMKDDGADLILCPNQSYFYFGKQQIRDGILKRQSKEKNIPIVSVNATGVGDIVKNIMIFDGSSLAYDNAGTPVAQLKRFAEDYQIIDIDLKQPMQAIELHTDNKYEEIYDALVFAQKELFDAIGIPNAQVHLSGGIDSAIVSALVTDAMGKYHTILISNPTEDNKAKLRGNAQYIADALGIKLYWNSTQEPYKAIVEQHKKAFGQEPDPTGKACIQAVTRTVQGVGAYHNFKSGIVATGNHTEIVEGWSTFHDIGSIGVHAIIGDLTKLELYHLAEHINNRHGKVVIPKNLYDGTVKPAAELADSSEDPLDYFVRSGICAELIRNKRSVFDLFDMYDKRTLDRELFPPDFEGDTVYDRYGPDEFYREVMEAYNNSKRSVFKSAQGAPIVIIAPRSRGFSNRETIINRYNGYYEGEKNER